MSNYDEQLKKIDNDIARLRKKSAEIKRQKAANEAAAFYKIAHEVLPNCPDGSNEDAVREYFQNLASCFDAFQENTPRNFYNIEPVF